MIRYTTTDRFTILSPDQTFNSRYTASILSIRSAVSGVSMYSIISIASL